VHLEVMTSGGGLVDEKLAASRILTRRWLLKNILSQVFCSMMLFHVGLGGIYLVAFWAPNSLVLAYVLISVMALHIVLVKVHLAAFWALALVALAQVLCLIMSLDGRLATEHLATFGALGLA
jgi:hypothetical protein